MQASLDKQKEFLQLYATPLGRFMMADAKNLTPRIAEIILAREAIEPGVSKTNKGGWHSAPNLLQWPELRFADLENLFRQAVCEMIAVTTKTRKFNADMKLTAWANVNRAGSFNSRHVHSHNHWSGVFYVKTADFSSDPIKSAGNLELHDPRGAVHMLKDPTRQPDEVVITPVEGGILIFPSWLFHSVNTFSIDKTRISIAFNANILKFQAA